MEQLRYSQSNKIREFIAGTPALSESLNEIVQLKGKDNTHKNIDSDEEIRPTIKDNCIGKSKNNIKFCNSLFFYLT